METVLSECKWNGLSTFIIENNRMRVGVVPEHGAKIVSIYDKKNDREWLVPPMRPIQPLSYGQSFIEAEMCGWDEMMPTITVCEWQGKELPDHGEVWSIPWSVEPFENGICCAVDGRMMPYHFSRSMSLSENKLLLQYQLKNNSDMTIPWLWAAHPQFAADEYTRIILLKGINRVVNVIHNDPVLGEIERTHDWPVIWGEDRQPFHLDQIASCSQYTCRKIYAQPSDHPAFAQLTDQKKSCALKLSWNPEQVPYLGIWIDEGVYNTTATAALEPSTGYYDGIDIALKKNRCPILKAGESVSWVVNLQIDDLHEGGEVQ